MHDKTPAISVYMSVHNAEPYLDACLASIVCQSDPDFEVLVIDDGSTDGSRTVLARWAGLDSRIRLIDSRRRLGLIGGLNLVVGEARAPLCARMDADDIARPDRLRRQREVLNADPSVVLVGTLSEGIDREGRRLRPRDRWRLIRPGRVPPFTHATVMFRRALFHEIGGYRELAWLWEDADLCYRMAAHGRIKILPEALYVCRMYDHSTTVRHSDERTLVAFTHMLEAAHDSKQQQRVPTKDEDEDSAGRRRTAAALFYVGASRLWAGVAPAVVGSLRDLPWWPPSVAALKVLVLATWGRWSPSSLRAVLRSCIRVRDAAAGFWLDEEVAVEWHFE